MLYIPSKRKNEVFTPETQISKKEETGLINDHGL